MWWELIGQGVDDIRAGANSRAEAKNINANIAQANQGLTNLQGTMQNQGQQLEGFYNQAYQPFTQNAGQNFQNFSNMVNQGSGLGYQPTQDFNYNLIEQAKKFHDNSTDYQIEQATKAIEGSSANRGKLFSSTTGKAITDRVQDIARQSWKDDMAMALQDRGFQYGQYSDDISRDRDAVNFTENQYQANVANLGKLSGMGMDATTNLSDRVGGVKADTFKGLNEAELSKIANLMSRQKGQSKWSTFEPISASLFED